MRKVKIGEVLIQHTSEIAKIDASAKSAHNRLNNVELQINAIHELSTSVSTLAVEVNSLVKKIDSTITEMKNSNEKQGERLGIVEKFKDNNESNIEKIEKLAEKVESLEKEPGRKWKKTTHHVITVILGAIALYFMFRYFGV